MLEIGGPDVLALATSGESDVEVLLKRCASEALREADGALGARGTSTVDDCRLDHDLESGRSLCRPRSEEPDVPLEPA